MNIVKKQREKWENGKMPAKALKYKGFLFFC